MKILRNCESCPLRKNKEEFDSDTCALGYTIGYYTPDFTLPYIHVSEDCNLDLIRILDGPIISPEWITKE